MRAELVEPEWPDTHFVFAPSASLLSCSFGQGILVGGMTCPLGENHCGISALQTALCYMHYETDR